MDCELRYGECVCPGSYAAALTNGHAAEGLEHWADLL